MSLVADVKVVASFCKHVMAKTLIPNVSLKFLEEYFALAERIFTARQSGQRISPYKWVSVIVWLKALHIASLYHSPYDEMKVYVHFDIIKMIGLPGKYAIFLASILFVATRFYEKFFFPTNIDIIRLYRSTLFELSNTLFCRPYLYNGVGAARFIQQQTIKIFTITRRLLLFISKQI